MHVHYLHREEIGRVFNTVFNTTINLCAFLNGTENSNALANYLKKELEAALPKGFYHPCPYSGELKMMNVTIAFRPEVAMFLKGVYRSVMRFYDDQDQNIVTAITDTLLK